jgi:nicotinic acid mononucleotide adenylyltransferase
MNKYIPTYELLNLLKQEHPTIEFWFVMGSDLVPSFRTWEFGDRLDEECNFIIVNRTGHELKDEKLLPKNHHMLSTFFDGSSTQIRNRIYSQFEKSSRLNLAINGLTTNSVIKYIIENELYDGKQ